MVSVTVTIASPLADAQALACVLPSGATYNPLSTLWGERVRVRGAKENKWREKKI
jgi:hypothetical protein